jgi:membrane protease YdiL (CAAX protease family)
VVSGTVALFVYRLVAILAARAAGLPLAGNSVTQIAEQGVLTTLLLLIPLSILVVGPAEELLFRGVIQPSLDAAVSRAPAIGHDERPVRAHPRFDDVGRHARPGPVSVTLAILFGLSVLLGYLYVWTDNLVVPILVHGFYDALLFGLAYVVLSSDPTLEEVTEASAAIVV